MTEELRSCANCEGRTLCRVEGDPECKALDIAAVCPFWPKMPPLTTTLSHNHDPDYNDETECYDGLTCPDCGKPLVIASKDYSDGTPVPCRASGHDCHKCPHAPRMGYCPTRIGWNRRNFSVTVLAHKEDLLKE